MPPAIIAGGIEAVGAIGGAVLSSSAQKNAANTAAAAETQAANNNLALAREFQQTNQNNLQPWLSSGAPANALINSFLFGPPGSAGGQSGAPAAAPQDFRAGLPSRSDWANGALSAIGAHGGADPIGALQGAITHLSPTQQQGWANYLAGHPDPDTVYEQRQTAAGVNSGQINAQQPSGSNAMMDGYQAFQNSPYYQFPLQEGMRQLNTGLASHGQIFSGDAAKAAIRYGQDYGSQRMGDFIGLAQSQSDQGLRAGGAIAGVGLNALNSMTNSNNAIGQAGANRAIAGGVANANMYAGIGQGLGQFAGSFLPASSYRGY